MVGAQCRAWDSGLSFLFRMSSPWGPLSPVAALQEKEPFEGTGAPGTQFQLLLISISISDPFEHEAFEVHIFSRLLIACALLGEMPAVRIHLLLLSVEGTLRDLQRRGDLSRVGVSEMCPLLLVARKGKPPKCPWYLRVVVSFGETPKCA